MKKGVFILYICIILLLTGCGNNGGTSNGGEANSAAMNTMDSISNEHEQQPAPTGTNNHENNTGVCIVDEITGNVKILTEAFIGAYDGYYFYETSENISSESFSRDAEQLKVLEIFYGSSIEGNTVIMSKEAAQYFGYENVDEYCFDIYVNSNSYYSLSNNALTAFLEPASGKIYNSKIIAGFNRGDKFDCFILNIDSSTISDVTEMLEDDELFYVNRLLAANQSIKSFKLSANGTKLLFDILEGNSEVLYLYDVGSRKLTNAAEIIGKEVLLGLKEAQDRNTICTEAVWDVDGNLVIIEKGDSVLNIDKYDLDKNVYDTVMVKHSLEADSIDLCAGGVYYEINSKRYFLKFRDFLPMEIDEDIEASFKQSPTGEKYTCLSSDRDTVFVIDIEKGKVSKYPLDKPCSYVEWADESTVRCCMGYEGEYIVFREVKIQN